MKVKWEFYGSSMAHGIIVIRFVIVTYLKSCESQEVLTSHYFRLRFLSKSRNFVENFLRQVDSDGQPSSFEIFAARSQRFIKSARNKLVNNLEIKLNSAENVAREARTVG